ncbi:MAG: carbohydrate ABC transporter substrate-binding protein, partial [Octadecabacter sp.]
MLDGEATAYLIGNFAVPHLREAGLDDTQIDFYQFPLIADVPQGEDAPTDTFHIPAAATNKDNARAFLSFIASADVQTEINAGAGLGQLPVNAGSAVDADEFLEQGFEMLSTNAQGGVAQFFDRDFPAEMASAGMEGLQEFMVFPDNLGDIIERLEETRLRVYE